MALAQAVLIPDHVDAEPGIPKVKLRVVLAPRARADLFATDSYLADRNPDK